MSRYHFEAPDGTPEEMRAMGARMLTDYEHEAGGLIAREIERGAEATAPA